MDIILIQHTNILNWNEYINHLFKKLTRINLLLNKLRNIESDQLIMNSYHYYYNHYHYNVLIHFSTRIYFTESCFGETLQAQNLFSIGRKEPSGVCWVWTLENHVKIILEPYKLWLYLVFTCLIYVMENLDDISLRKSIHTLHSKH